MAIARFFRVAALGGFVADSEWAGEQWQFGFSFVARTDGGSPSREQIKAPTPECLVSPSGATQTTSTWQASYGFAGAPGNSMTTAQQINIANAVKAFWEAWRTHVFNEQELQAVKLTAYEQGTSGKPEVINGSSYFQLVTPIPGGHTTFRLPPQCAVVLSQRTSGRGPGGRGRAYLPATGMQLSVDGTVPSAVKSSLLTAAQSLGTTISANAGLVSVVNQQAYTYSDVTMWGVGNHVDTQRRRAQGVPESYQFIGALG